MKNFELFDIGRHRDVNFKKLENAVYEAAARFGWTGETADVRQLYWAVGDDNYPTNREYGKRYGHLAQCPGHTEIRLRGNFLKKLTIETFRESPQFDIKYLKHYVTKKKVEEYFDSVLDELSKEHGKQEAV